MALLFFHSFSQTRKVVEEICSYLLTLELNWEISTPGALFSELADYLLFSYLS